MINGKLLIADDNKSVLQALYMFLQFEFELVQTLANPNSIIHELESKSFDIVLLDMNFTAGLNTGNEGVFWLREIKKRFPDIEVIMFTAYGDIALAVKALKEGAADFILKPWDNEKLIATLKSAYRLRKSNQEISKLRSNEVILKKEINKPEQLITGKSAVMKDIMKLVQKIAKTDANVLITGENGTGKEVIAKEIHKLSSRSDEIFVMVDLSALTESLFESELFGHKKGAFTDAREDRTGKFILAEKGSLLLDEIGNLPLHLQSKLLTVLQTRIVTPVGSNKETITDFRLICATNKNIHQMVAENQFRQDLLYRINTIQIHIPPLRERKEDIGDFAIHFLEIFKKKYQKPDLSLSDQAIKKLTAFPWHGNIRELQHTIEKAVILSERDTLNPEDFEFGFKSHNDASEPETFEDMEKKMIISAIKRHGNNMSAVANKLGITRPTLYTKIRKYGI